MLNVKQDGVTVAQYVKARLGRETKVILHGISIGGAVASYIAR